ncbi:MAG: hypothetical protein LBB67_02140, partial [Oscillospiraceae bacterium]|nr:hypothetical protein [Oscillospiraceae bacterium]
MQQQQSPPPMFNNPFANEQTELVIPPNKAFTLPQISMLGAQQHGLRQGLQQFPGTSIWNPPFLRHTRRTIDGR